MTEKTTPAPTIKGKMPAKDFSMGFNVNKATLPRNRTVTIDDSSVNSLSTFIWFGEPLLSKSLAKPALRSRPTGGQAGAALGPMVEFVVSRAMLQTKGLGKSFRGEAL